MNVIEISSDSFDKEILQSEMPVLLEFWAPWCGPCDIMNPILEEVAKEAQGYIVAKINADENQDLARHYKIRSMPTLFAIDKGEIIDKSIGVISKKKVIRFMEKSMK